MKWRFFWFLGGVQAICFWPVTEVSAGDLSGGDQLGYSDQIVSDEIEDEVAADSLDSAMFGFAHRAVLLAPTEDAFDHCPASLGNCVTGMARRTCVDRACAPLACLCQAVVLRHMRRDVYLAQGLDVVGGVVSFVFARCDAPA